MTGYVVGVDGGGTRTRAVIVDAHGHVVARAEGPGAVVAVERPEVASAAVASAVRAAARDAGISLPVEALWAGLSGAGREDSKAAVKGALRGEGLAETVEVGTDVEAAFHDAFGDGPGVMLIAGTGSIAWARSEAGEMARVGGWGQQLGDEGSGFSIGDRALRWIVRGDDGRGPVPGFRGPIMDHLALSEAQELIAWTAAATKGQVAALVPFVARAASEEDAPAAEILAWAVEALERHVIAILERSGPWTEPPRLALWGGLIWEGGHLRDPLTQTIARHRIELVDREIDPPGGAARLALGLRATHRS